MKHKHNLILRFADSGYSLVEVILVMGIFSFVVFAVLQLSLVSNQSSLYGRSKEKAQFLIQENLEEIKNIRQNRWNDLVNGKYVLIQNSLNNLQLVSTTSGELLGTFTRYLQISDVLRDSTGKIVAANGTPDPSTKNVTVTVSWSGLYPGSLTQNQYFSRYPHNNTWLQTYDTDFNKGKLTGTVVTKMYDGEVTLGAGGHGDWCKPAYDTQLDLPRQGVANAVTAIHGEVFTGTGVNASGESFEDIKVDDNYPPNATISGVFNGYKTNDIFGEPGYGYIATDTNNKEIVILSLTTNPITEIGYFDAPGVTDANSVRVANNVGFMTQGNIFRAFSLTNGSGQPDRTGSRPELGNITLLGTGQKFVISNGFAYIPISGSQYEMQIIDVRTPSNLKAVGKIDVDLNRTEVNQSGVDVFVTATRAYLITTQYTGRADFFIIDITNNANPSIIQILKNGTLQNAEYDTNLMNPHGIEIVPGNIAIVVGTGGQQYQVVRIGNDNPVYCGGMNVSSGIFDSSAVIDTVSNTAFTYIVTGDSSAELKIIEGGPGLFYNSGTYESQTFDAGDIVAYNRIYATSDIPISTNIKYRAAVLNPSPGSDCQSVTFSELNFIGADGTNGSYLDGNNLIPLAQTGSGYLNPGRCLRIRAYFSTTDPTSIPVLYDFRVNYSP